MQKHLQSCFLLAFIVVILTACKSLPPRLDSMTDRFVCFNSKNAENYREQFLTEVEARNLDCATLSRTPIAIPSKIDPNGAASSTENLFSSVSDTVICVKYNRFYEGVDVPNAREQNALDVQIKKRGLNCRERSLAAFKKRMKQKRAESADRRKANENVKRVSNFETATNDNICSDYNSFFKGSIDLSTAERIALRNQMEKRKLNCSASTAKVAPIKQDTRKNTVSQAADVERQILARYGKADEVERFGSAAVFKYCKTGLIGDSYTYVWSDGQSVKQIYKGKWTAPFLCAGAHRSVDWVRTMENSALVLIQPNQRPRKSFGEAMAEGMEQSMQSNQGVYNSLIKGGGDTVTCNKLGDMRFPKQVYTFQGSFCPMGYIQAF